MGAGCQRNGLEMGVGRGEEVCWKGHPYIRQLANSREMTTTTTTTIRTTTTLSIIADGLLVLVVIVMSVVIAERFVCCQITTRWTWLD